MSLYHKDNFKRFFQSSWPGLAKITLHFNLISINKADNAIATSTVINKKFPERHSGI